jgi:MSHA pilin protein MshC
VIVISSILAVLVLPRFRAGAFEEVRFHDEALAALRYAHRSAVTTQRTVCVDFDGNTITLRYNQVYGVTTCPGSHPLTGPDGETPFTVTATGAAGFSATPTDFYFDRVGKPYDPVTSLPMAAQTLSINGGLQIVIESETGLVR